MPRVTKKRKNAGGKAGRPEFPCQGCSTPIVAGEEFYEWSFRYGGTYRRHVSHGYPRPSMLTQSKMGEVYAAVETVEDLISVEGWEVDDVRSALDELAGVAEQVADEYREAAEPFGGQGEHAERADEVESFGSEIQGVDLDDYDPEGTETEDDWRERIKGEVEEAISAAP